MCFAFCVLDFLRFFAFCVFDVVPGFTVYVLRFGVLCFCRKCVFYRLRFAFLRFAFFTFYVLRFAFCAFYCRLYFALLKKLFCRCNAFYLVPQNKTFLLVHNKKTTKKYRLPGFYVYVLRFVLQVRFYKMRFCKMRFCYSTAFCVLRFAFLVTAVYVFAFCVLRLW